MEDSYTSEILLSDQEIGHKLRRISSEILERHGDTKNLAFVGIHSRGVPLAQRVLQLLKDDKPDIEFGTVDISLYRDDLDNLGTVPEIRSSEITFPLEAAHIILFDDVLFTGRTIRAAIDSLMDFGRPARIELATLVDRRNRELPIQADYVGDTINSSRHDYIQVRLREIDGEDDGVYHLIPEKHQPS